MTGFFRMASVAAIAVAVSACDRGGKQEAAKGSAPAGAEGSASTTGNSGSSSPSNAANPGTSKPNGRYATVDLQRVMQESRPALAAQTRAKNAQAAVVKELEARKARIADVVTEYEALVKRGKEFNGPPAEGRQLQLALDWRKAVIQAYEADRNEFVKRRNQLLKLRANADLAKLLKDVRGPMDELSQSKGYAWVIDRSGLNTNKIATVVYMKESAPDLTNELIRILDEKHPELPAVPKSVPVSK